jgi:hypothetical protein
MKILNWAWLPPVLVAATFSADSLRKGQVIKQFEAYSIAESLSSAPLGILSTTIPCDGGIPWTLEPPVFHELGAAAIAAWPGFAALAPLLAYALLVAWVLRFSTQLFADPRLRLALTWSVALAPAFARFSIQFIPDVLATALLLASATLFLERKDRAALALLPLAVLAKALVFAAVPFLLYWRARERTLSGEAPPSRIGSAARALGQSALVAAPFLAWVAAVRAFSESNVIHSQGMLRSYALENWSLLLEPAFYARFVTWIWIKGAGWPLGALAIAAFFAKPVPGDRAASLLRAWCAGLVPYWLLVRQGNRVHDYYSLAFILPLAILGARQLLTLPPGPAAMIPLKGALLAASLALGIHSLAGMSEIPLPPGQSRPVFCGSEIRKVP